MKSPISSKYYRFYKHVAFVVLDLPTPGTVFYHQVPNCHTAVAQNSFWGLSILDDHVTICRYFFQFSTFVTSRQNMMDCLKTSHVFLSADIDDIF